MDVPITSSRQSINRYGADVSYKTPVKISKKSVGVQFLRKNSGFCREFSRFLVGYDWEAGRYKS